MATALSDWILANLDIDAFHGHYWRLDEASGQLQDDPSAFVERQWNITGTPGYQAESDVFEDGDFAMNWDGTNDYGTSTIGILNSTMDSGQVTIGFRTSTTANSVLMETGNSGGAQRLGFRITGSGNLQYGWVNVAPTNQYLEETDTAWNDGNWHIVTFVQPEDGTGVRIYVDGAKQPTTRSLSGTASVDHWYQELTDLSPTGPMTRIAANGATGAGSRFQGDISFITTSTNILTDSEASDLAESAGVISGTAKGKAGSGRGRRRRGRRGVLRTNAAGFLTPVTFEDIFGSILNNHDR